MRICVAVKRKKASTSSEGGPHGADIDAGGGAGSDHQGGSSAASDGVAMGLETEGTAAEDTESISKRRR
jgi:hypothetical protein